MNVSAFDAKLDLVCQINWNDLSCLKGQTRLHYCIVSLDKLPMDRALPHLFLS